MADEVRWDEVFPPLDISVTARAIAQMCREAWDRADDASVYWHGRRPTYPIGYFESLYDNIVMYLKAYDEGRTRTIEFYKKELIELHNRLPQRIVLEKSNG